MYMDNYGAGSIGAGAIVVLGLVYKIFQHFKCASRCCGKEATLDINMDTPPTNKDELTINK